MSAAWFWNDNPMAYMTYKGEIYSTGTEVLLSNEYINTHTFDDKKIWKYATFSHSTTYYGRFGYVFKARKYFSLDLMVLGVPPSERLKVMSEIAPNFVIYPEDLSMAIEEITIAVKFTKATEKRIEESVDKIVDEVLHPKPDWEHPGLLGLWIGYLALMFGSLIFRQWYLIWPVITFIFIKWRSNILKL